MSTLLFYQPPGPRRAHHGLSPERSHLSSLYRPMQMSSRHNMHDLIYSPSMVQLNMKKIALDRENLRYL